MEYFQLDPCKCSQQSVCVTMMIGTKIHPFVGLVHVIFWWLSMFKDFIQFLFLVIVSRSFIFLICHIPFKWLEGRLNIREL